MIVTLLGYYVLFGKRHRRKRKVLAEELRQAQRQVRKSFDIVLYVSSVCICVFNLIIIPPLTYLLMIFM